MKTTPNKTHQIKQDLITINDENEEPSLNFNKSSYSIWIRPYTIQNSFTENDLNIRAILGSRNDGKGYGCYLDKDRYVVAYTGNQTLKSSSPITLNRWTNVTVTYGKSNVRDVEIKLYVNGTLSATGTGTVSTISGVTNTINDVVKRKTWFIGHEPQTKAWFDGDMSKYRFFDKTLSLEEVQYIYNTNSPYPYVGKNWELVDKTLPRHVFSSPGNSFQYLIRNTSPTQRLIIKGVKTQTFS